MVEKITLELPANTVGGDILVSAETRERAELAATRAEQARDQAEVFSATTVALQDAAMASVAGNAASEFSQVMGISARAAAASGRRLDGERVLWVGDSITALETPLTQGQSYTRFAAWQSGGRVREVYRTAVSGNRSDQQLVAVQSLLAGGARPTLASVMVGTNDLSQGIPVATWQANVVEIVNTLRNAGCEPVLCTLPPRSGPANPKPPSTVNGVWNAWLRDYAAAQNIVLVDIWAAVTGADGEWKPGWANPADGVHPTAVAQKAMGDAWIAAVRPHLRASAFPLLDGTASGGARESGGTFTAAGSLPAGITTVGASVFDVVADPRSPSKFALRMVTTNPASIPYAYSEMTKASGAFQAGDTIEVVAKFRVVSASVLPGFGVRLTVTEFKSGQPTNQHTTFCSGQSIPSDEYLTVSFRVKLAADTDVYRLAFAHVPDGSGADSSEARLASFRMYNVTALGV